MAINMNSLCIRCLTQKHLQAAEKLDFQKAQGFTKDFLELMRKALDGNNSTVVAAQINRLYQQHFGLEQDRFMEEKRLSNAFIKARLPQITALVESQADPVYAGLQFAVLGNYLDFSALMGQVSFEKLDEMLEDALKLELDLQVYAQLCAELETAKRLLYVTDNAGEIGFDRICAQQLQKKYPQLQITFCVRGGPAHNDAMREDAAFMELEFPLVDTGNDVGGLDLPNLSAEAKKAMDDADVILAKGMGNTESTFGCEYNIYYAFLVKCLRFQEFFNKPYMTPMLIKNAKCRMQNAE